MFVSQARYDRLQRECDSLVRRNREGRVMINLLTQRLLEWQEAAKFLEKQMPAIEKMMMTHEEINNLIRLCHPDLHGGNELSTKMTARLLEIKAAKKE